MSAFVCGWLWAACAGLGPADDVDVARALSDFDKAWPSRRADYRTEDDDSWRSYALAWRALVASGDVETARSGLGHDNQQVRALCARALGPMGDARVVPDLVRLLENDPWPTVRLLAVDSLGMLPTDEGRAAMEAARKTQKNGDVLLHLDTELRRKQGPPTEEVHKAVLALDEVDFAMAAIGEIAPELVLEDCEGELHSLAEFEGEKHVVLVFVYGDG